MVSSRISVADSTHQLSALLIFSVVLAGFSSTALFQFAHTRAQLCATFAFYAFVFVAIVCSAWVVFLNATQAEYVHYHWGLHILWLFTVLLVVFGTYTFAYAHTLHLGTLTSKVGFGLTVGVSMVVCALVYGWTKKSPDDYEEA